MGADLPAPGRGLSRLRWLAAALLMAAVAVIATRWRVDTALDRFAGGDDPRLGRLAAALPGAEPARTMIFALAHADPAIALAAGETLRAALAAEPEIAWARSGPEPGVDEALFELYAARCRALASDEPEREIPERTSDAGLRAGAARLRHELARPTGPLVRRLAERDPWLFCWDRLQALRAAAGGGMTVVEGRFVADDGQALVLAATRSSPFDGARQAPLAEAIDRIVAELEREHPGLAISRSALHRHAVAAERAIRADVQRTAAVGSVGAIVLLLLVLGSIRALLMLLVPVAAGMAIALAATLALRGSVHSVTLAIGATLVGVCIDYPIHWTAHELHGRGRGARTWIPIAIGAATTVVGFAALGATALPGVEEIGLFAAVGVGAAVLCTRAFLPLLRPAPSRTASWISGALARGFSRLGGRRLPWILLGLTALVAGLGLPRMQWVDDPRALTGLDPALVAEDERVRALVGRADASRVIAVFADDFEGALRANDAVARRLDPLVRAGTLELRSLHDLLWSADLQRRNLAALDAVDDLPGRTAAALREHGFRPEAFDLAGASAPAAPLTWAELEASPLSAWISPFVLPVAEGACVLTFVRDVRVPDAVATAVEDVPGAVWFDQAGFTTALYQRYRTRSLELVGFGLLGVTLVLGLRYRAVRPTIAALVPAVLAACAALGLVAWLGLALLPFHLASILLILAMGVDYGVFMVESDRDQVAATLLGMTLSCATTVISFGALAASSNPALRALGLTTALGVLASLVLAPCAWLVLRSDRR